MTTMTNPPIEFQVGEETWSIRFSFAAICAIERAFEMPIGKVVQEVFGADMRMDQFLSIFHACLLLETGGGPARATETVTREEAANAIDVIGIKRAVALVQQAVEQSPMFAKRPSPGKPKVRGAGPAPAKGKAKAKA